MLCEQNFINTLWSSFPQGLRRKDNPWLIADCTIDEDQMVPVRIRIRPMMASTSAAMGDAKMRASTATPNRM